MPFFIKYGPAGAGAGLAAGAGQFRRGLAMEDIRQQRAAEEFRRAQANQQLAMQERNLENDIAQQERDRELRRELQGETIEAQQARAAMTDERMRQLAEMTAENQRGIAGLRDQTTRRGQDFTNERFDKGVKAQGERLATKIGADAARQAAGIGAAYVRQDTELSFKEREAEKARQSREKINADRLRVQQDLAQKAIQAKAEADQARANKLDQRQVHAADVKAFDYRIAFYKSVYEGVQDEIGNETVPTPEQKQRLEAAQKQFLDEQQKRIDFIRQFGSGPATRPGTPTGAIMKSVLDLTDQLFQQGLRGEALVRAVEEQVGVA